MKRVYRGKTKDVYDLGQGRYRLFFKDDVTGEGGVFDPGANKVAFSIEGMGKGNLRVSKMFFLLLNGAGIRTHYLDADVEAGTMDVIAAQPLGQGVEFICRFRAVGSFLRRYGAYVNEGDRLDAYVEATLKDDERGDPLVTVEGLGALGIMTATTFAQIKESTVKISSLIRDFLWEKGLELYDIKLEFGRTKAGEIILIDELSAGNMRVYKKGEFIPPVELTQMLGAD
ncbi:MAG: phosphoribosylaminoimidazolesuccinocarboxamide synthase [Firmicutes bacterium]|nr:phosphoribosylaminoimidazolesuccinocarboxamide synthase [Bacillota bacterium]